MEALNQEPETYDFAAGLADVVVVLDEDGVIRFANQAVKRLLGWDPADVVGRSFTTFLPESLSAGYVSRLAEFVESGPAEPGGVQRVAAVRADGSELAVDVGCSLIGTDQEADLRGGTRPRRVLALIWEPAGGIDAGQYRQISEELLAVLTQASGPADTVVPQLLAVIARGLGFDVATVWRQRPGQDALTGEQVWHREDPTLEPFVRATLGSSLKLGEAVPGIVAATGEPISVPEVSNYPHFRRSAIAATVGLRSGFAFPVRAGERNVGVIELYSRRSRQPDEPLFQAVAGAGAHLGEFIERLELESRQAQLVAELEEARRRQDFLLRASRALVGTRGFEETVRGLARMAVPRLGDICLVDIVGADGSLIRVAGQHADPRKQPLVDELRHYPPLMSSDHPSARVLRTRESAIDPQISEKLLRETTHSDRHFGLVQSLQFRSYVAAPLLVGDRTLGAITIISADSGRRLGSPELTLLEDLARQVASVVERARDYDEQRRISRTLQHSLLPGELPTPEGVQVAARYVASNDATEVGGDFYDVVPLGDDLAVVVGDVEGHDMPAITAMGQLRSALRAYLELGSQPEEVLNLLDRFAEHHVSRRLATVCLAILSPDSGRMRIASAGHYPPVVAGPGSPAESVTVDPGPPLGLGMGVRPATEVTLPHPATLVFFTDGLVESREDGPEARLHLLLRAITESWTRPAEDLCDAALAAATAGARIEDDIALLVVQLTGSADKGDRRPK